LILVPVESGIIEARMSSLLVLWYYLKVVYDLCVKLVEFLYWWANFYTCSYFFCFV